jgi:hypothetical protein
MITPKQLMKILEDFEDEVEQILEEDKHGQERDQETGKDAPGDGGVQARPVTLWFEDWPEGEEA